jgi:hypothetical protein
VDLIKLMRLRDDVLSLDSAQSLTRGSLANLPGALVQFMPVHGSYAAISSPSGGGAELIGQITHTPGSRSARLAFLAPASAVSSPELPGLLEKLVGHAGEQGAFHVLGEVDELSPAFEGLRRTGFSVYAWQRIWKLDALPLDGGKAASAWQPVSDADEPAVRMLFQNLVPPLVQSAEPLPNRRLRGLAYRQDGEIMAYVQGISGSRGMFLHPLVHPDLTEYSELVRSLMQSLPPLGRPVYLAVRSYQSWLENALADLPAETSPRHALLVKHLAKLQRVPLTARLGVEQRSSEVPTASIVNQVQNLEPPLQRPLGGRPADRQPGIT